MPTNTSKFNLVKPLKSEKYNVDVFNGNADIIDSQIYSKTEVDTALNGKADKLFATNLVTNGDFSNGTTGWSANSGTITLDTIKFKSPTRSIKHNTVGAFNKFGANLGQTFSLNDKLYVAYEINPDSDLVNVRFTLRRTTITGTVVGNSYNDSSRSYGINVWTRNSFIIVNDNSTDVKFAVFEPTTLANYNVDNVFILNLTALFGAGNEPTKEQMDYLLSNFPNSWFNGTVELMNYKQLLDYVIDIDTEKVDKIIGKGLSTEDYTTAEKAKVADLSLDTNARLADVENKVNIPLTNRVVNPDFVNTSGWTGLFSTVSASTNILTTTGLGTNAQTRVRRNEGKRDGCRYYAKAFFRHIGTKMPTFGIAVGGSTVVSQVKQNDDWHEISGITSIPLDTNDKWYELTSTFLSSSDALSEQVEHKKFIVINLTNEFGAGSEPSIEEIELLIEKFPERFFVGTASVFSSEATKDVILSRYDDKTGEVYESLRKRFDNIERKLSSNKVVLREAKTTVVNEQNAEIVYGGSWSLLARANTSVDGYSMVTNAAGRSATLKFYGDYIALWLEKSYIGGIAEIYLDGQKMADVDTYIIQNPGFSFPVFERKIPFGEHEIKVISTGNKNALSGNSYIYLDCFVYRSEVASVTEKFRSGIILTFDDSRNYITSSAPILNARGLKATCFVNPDVFNRLESTNPRMNYEIQALKIYDWEISSHTNIHESLTSVSLQEAEKRIRDAINWLKSRGLDYAHLASPFGQINTDVLNIIKKYHASHVLVGTAPVSFNPLDFDPHQIPRYQIQEDTNLTTLSNFLDTVKAKGETTVLCLHGVASGATGINMTPEKFNAFLDVIQSKNMPIMRMKDFFGA